jgi:hypothetical protein
MSNKPKAKTALFIDFDNVYICLSREDPQVAEAFARNPERVLSWLERKVQAASDTHGGRRLLMRRCYMNPRAFYNFRPEFIRAAFDVVDCPPLTAGGKTSTDIHMIMEIMDALDHRTKFDEFILLSGDADFTPILVRLREHDRRTIVLPVGPSSAAYRAAADHVLEQDELIEEVLVLREKPIHASRTRISEDQRRALKEIGVNLFEVITGTGPVRADFLPGIFSQHPQFRESTDWLGLGSLRRMTEAIISQDNRLIFIDDEDPWLVDKVLTEDSAFISAAERPLDEKLSIPKLTLFIQRILEESATPINLARLSQVLVSEFGDKLRSNRWQGTGSFRSFLERLDLRNISISTTTPGYIYDANRHEIPTEDSASDEFTKEYPAMADIAARISYVTETPYLMPEVYAVLFKEIKKEVEANGYNLIQTAKNVRDYCNGKGVPISRKKINFVLRGITFSGYTFQDKDLVDVREIGKYFLENIYNLCNAAEMALEESDKLTIREWILGAVNGGSK